MDASNSETLGTQLDNKHHDWSIRTFAEGDEGKILELWRAVHPERQVIEQPWLRWRRWMYKETPGGSKTWLADDNGKVVGQRSVIFRNLKVGNDVVKTWSGINAAVHPDYRHQKIYTTLHTISRSEFKKTGIHISLGFPNNNSFPLGVKLGNYNLGFGRKMVKVLKWDNILKTRIRSKFILQFCVLGSRVVNILLFRASRTQAIKGLTITQVSSFDKRIDTFWSKVSSQFQIILERSTNYLNWRFVNVPDTNYYKYIAEKAGEIHGYLVLRYFQDEHKKKAVIYDFLAESKKVAHCLLSTASEQCRKDGIDYISWCGISNKAHRSVIKKNGFMDNPFGKGWRFTGYSSHPDISKEFLTNPNNWLVQTGDSDIL
jgi:hypothetical protein